MCLSFSLLSIPPCRPAAQRRVPAGRAARSVPDVVTPSPCVRMSSRTLETTGCSKPSARATLPRSNWHGTYSPAERWVQIRWDWWGWRGKSWSRLLGKYQRAWALRSSLKGCFTELRAPSVSFYSRPKLHSTAEALTPLKKCFSLVWVYVCVFKYTAVFLLIKTWPTLVELMTPWGSVETLCVCHRVDHVRAVASHPYKAGDIEISVVYSGS